MPCPDVCSDSDLTSAVTGQVENAAEGVVYCLEDAAELLTKPGSRLEALKLQLMYTQVSENRLLCPTIVREVLRKCSNVSGHDYGWLLNNCGHRVLV